MPYPTVGRIVHYTNLGDKDEKYPAETQAALITKVHSEVSVNLCVFYSTGMFFMTSVTRAEEPERGRWNWPRAFEGG